MHRFGTAALLLVALGCSDNEDAGPLDVSNGLEVMAGVEASQVTTLSGACSVNTENGEISCEGLVVRLNAAGVDHGIGWELEPPAAASCAGSDVTAPSIAVFSFGSLEVPRDSDLTITGPHAVALLATDSIEVAGSIGASDTVGGFRGDIWEGEDLIYYGPSPGEDATGEDPRGAGGAGGATDGGAGGNDGGAGGSALPAQFEPLCGGSAGGTVGHYDPSEGGVIYGTGGGAGGAALLLAAGNSITFDGPATCGISLDGGVGEASERGGHGGGAGGTLSLESPTVSIAGECRLSAVGGLGTTSATSQLGGDAGDGETDPGPGDDGEYGGGGGGSAGFVRVRSSICPDDAAFEPSATCEEM